MQTQLVSLRLFKHFSNTWFCNLGKLAAAGGLVVSSQAVMAEKEAGFSGELSATYLSTSGNSESTNAALGATLDYKPSDSSRWLHSAYAGAQFAEEDNEQSAERYEAGFKTLYNQTPRTYWFGALDFEKDLFSGVDTRYSLTAGVGRHLIDLERHKLDGELGVGIRYLEFADGDDTTDAILRGLLDYSWLISKTSTFNQKVLVEVGNENTYLQSDTSLTLLIAGSVSAKLGYTIKRNSEVPDDVEKTDTYTTVSLLYGF